MGVRNDGVAFSVSEEADNSLRCPGKLRPKSVAQKVQVVQLTPYHWVTWPLKLSEMASSIVSKMDAKTNWAIGRWLGLPRCLSEVGLLGQKNYTATTGIYQPGYKQEKARLAMEWRESSDRSVMTAKARVRTGRKWRARTEMDREVQRLQHLEIVRAAQTGRSGLGWG